MGVAFQGLTVEVLPRGWMFAEQEMSTSLVDILLTSLVDILQEMSTTTYNIQFRRLNMEP